MKRGNEELLLGTCRASEHPRTYRNRGPDEALAAVHAQSPVFAALFHEEDSVLRWQPRGRVRRSRAGHGADREAGKSESGSPGKRGPAPKLQQQMDRIQRLPRASSASSWRRSIQCSLSRIDEVSQPPLFRAVVSSDFEMRFQAMDQPERSPVRLEAGGFNQVTALLQRHA